ncbi:MAG: transrane transport protein [Aeromicrobium sp.]|nr:transrane transport protein [Aeromicrobium sp.]
MNAVMVGALRVVIVLGMIGSVFVQAVMVPLLARDLEDDVNTDVAAVAAPLIVIVVLGIIAIQVSAICVWRLLTMVRRGTVFSSAAFRYVDTIIAAIAAAAILTFATGAVLAPGEAVAPGVVLLIGGLGGLVAGVALIVLIQRMLLAQAVDRDAEAVRLASELDEVI